MVARFLVMVAVLLALAAMLPVGGCGDNDDSTAGIPCCPVCGDGVCTGDERPCGCRQDCPDDGESCVAEVPVCGNGVCDVRHDPAESHERCPEDCPLDCRICGGFVVDVNGTRRPGTACPVGTTEAYRDGTLIVCNTCSIDPECPAGARCQGVCGPGCENDAGSCCLVRNCVQYVG